MSFNRRQFVAASATSLTFFSSVCLSNSSPHESFVVVDRAAPESQLFAGFFSRSHHLSCALTDVMALPLHIAQQFRAGHSVYGCTLGAQTFVIDEMLRPHGLVLEVVGRHKKVDSYRWHHEVHLSSVARNQSIFSETNWPRRYAQALYEVDAERVTVAPTELLVDRIEDADTCGFAATWRVRVA